MYYFIFNCLLHLFTRIAFLLNFNSANLQLSSSFQWKTNLRGKNTFEWILLTLLLPMKSFPMFITIGLLSEVWKNQAYWHYLVSPELITTGVLERGQKEMQNGRKRPKQFKIIEKIVVKAHFFLVTACLLSFLLPIHPSFPISSKVPGTGIQK